MRIIAAIMFWLAAAGAALAAEQWFEVERLNEGLGAPPEGLDRSTPQSTLEELIDRSAAGDFDAAAHLLNLNDIDATSQADRGPDLARKLQVIMQRKVVIDWAGLLERPDALDANATSDSAVAGQARRSILLWVLDLEDRGVAIRLNRLKPEGESAVWVFSRQSVDNIDRLYALYGPSRLEEALPDDLRNEAFWGLMWWEVIGLPLVFLFALLTGAVAYRLTLRIANWAQGIRGARLVEAARAPIILLAVTAVTSVCTKTFFVFSGQIDTLLSPLIALGYVAAALVLVINVVDAVMDQIVDLDDEGLRAVDAADRRAIATRISAGRRALIVVIVMVGAGVVLASADVFRTFGFSLLASAGALTLVLGFAARKVLGNIMSSLQIALNQSARIGDKVMYRDYLCTVERINFTYVQLRDWTGVRLIVPVEEFVAEPFENWTLKEPAMLRLIRIEFAHAFDIAPMREAFKEIVADQDETELGDTDDLNVVVTDHSVLGKTVTFCLPCANPHTAWQLSCDVREALLDRAAKLAEDGAEVFPTAQAADAAA